jgi:hypothetical protein
MTYARKTLISLQDTRFGRRTLRSRRFRLDFRTIWRWSIEPAGRVVQTSAAPSRRMCRDHATAVNQDTHRFLDELTT